MVKLMKADERDCHKIHEIQVLSFKLLLEKYKDIDTNPGAETFERIVQRMHQDFTDYYFIMLHTEKIGAIRVVRLGGDICRISPMFILPEYQGNGYAQEALREIEALYPYSKGWNLDTIKEEYKLCYLYEKMGYLATGKEEKIKDNMTIVYYEKCAQD